MKFLCSLFLASLTAQAAEPVYPSGLEKLKDLTIEVSSLHVWNDNTFLTKSRTLEAALLYCYETDEGQDSKIMCAEIGKTGSWKLTAGRNPNAVTMMAAAEYKPTSKKAKFTTDVATIKRLIAKYNPDGDLPHYMRVELRASNWTTAKGATNIEFFDTVFHPRWRDKSSFQVESVEAEKHTWAIIGVTGTFNE